MVTDHAQDVGQELISQITLEVQKIDSRLREFQDNIEQLEVQVRRQQQKYALLAAEIQTIHDNIASTPREDILKKYDEALDTRWRLATLTGQLENTQNSQSVLSSERDLLNQIAQSIQGVTFSEQPTQQDGKQTQSVDVAGIIRAQEEERQRLARQMHDGPAQSLTNFIMQADICRKVYDRNPDRAMEELDNLKSSATGSFQRVRDFIFDLSPMMLGDLGVTPTVERYVENFREKNDIETALSISGQEARHENYVEIMVYRTIQDMMSLARDYADATRIAVQVSLASDPILITIEDNGRTFDTSAIMGPEDDRYGKSDARVPLLITYREKIRLVGGSLQVFSTEDAGNIVRVEIPPRS
jgi:two-component system, NarL family, sensor histidine kinase DegS